MVERGKQTSSNHGLRLAAGLALAAVGATAVSDRIRRSKSKGPDRTPAPKTEFEHGRGTPHGPVGKPSLEAGYEIEDTNVRLLAIIMAVSIMIMASSTAGVFLMFGHFDRHFQAADKRLTTEQRAPIVPPLPHLQADPYREIDAALDEQRQRLTTYGWDSPSHRQAHIPIDRAIQRVIGRPLDSALKGDDIGTASAPPPAAVELPTARPQAKPANSVQGEGRPGSIAPSFDPDKTEAKP